MKLPTSAQALLPQVFHMAFLRHQLTILMYHAVVRSPLSLYDACFLNESSFRRQMSYLKKRFEVIALSEAVRRLRNGKIDRPTAVITFDDGFQNNYDVAFPILREFGLPATVFLVTGLVNTTDTLWHCRLNRGLAQTRKPSLEWNGCRFDLSRTDRRVRAAQAIAVKLKQVAHPRLLAELRGLILKLGDDPDCPIAMGSPYRMLSRGAIREMAASGLIEFGPHTHSHSILSRLSPEERRKEIEKSVTAIRELTGRPCELFAYPNGSAEDYDKETIATLEAYGVRASVTAIPGPNNSMTPPMELRRYGV
ncbi:MAG: polysaccharide deacetylase family protein, partial [Candidatus Binatia bacterium]